MYQTGGAAKPQPPSRQQVEQVLGRTQPRLPNGGFSQFSRENNEALSAQRQAMQRAAGLAALGNRQRAAAGTQRPTPRPAPRTMPRPRPMSYMGSQPARPRPRVPTLPANRNITAAQQRENALTALGNRQRAAANRFNVPSIPRAPRNVSRPMPYMGSQRAGERQRIQQQIAQLQARLRQLGG